METRITATDLAKGLSDVLNRVRYQGEKFVIERNGEPVAALVPSAPKLGVTLRQVATRLADLTMPGDGYAEDLEAMQSAQERSEAPVWRS